MKSLIDLLAPLSYEGKGASLEKNISDIVYDSRKAVAGTVFVCMIGAETDGHKYARSAVEKGCRAVVIQKGSEETANLPVGEPGYEDLSVVVTEDTRHALALMSDIFFDHPSGDLKVIGITGTKGKTTTTYIMETILEDIGVSCGVIGTNGAGYGDVTIPTVNTTPESYELQKILRQMADDGVQAVAMEVSSIGVQWHRVDGVDFFCGVFTNFSPDHIGGNEHKTLEEYFGWKKAFMDKCDKVVACLDDEKAEAITADVVGRKVFYGYHEKADYRAVSAVPMQYADFLGVRFELLKHGKPYGTFEISQPGNFSVHNAMAALAVAELMGYEAEQFLPGLKKVSVPGRAQVLTMTEDYGIIIDFAHNMVSLQSIVDTMLAYRPKRIIVLYGTVGDRAQVRRENMGTLSAQIADFTIVTEDDPAFEDPRKICAEIAYYLEQAGARGKYAVLPDRAEACRYAVSILQPGDILICCGKGHEQFMKRNGRKYAFSEEAVLREALAKKEQ